MGVYTEEARNAMLAALNITHVGFLTVTATFLNVTSAGDTFTEPGHGLSVGDILVPGPLVGGAGIVAGDVYFVQAVPNANTFKITRVPGGAPITPTTALTDGTFKRLLEISGGAPAYARGAIAYAAPSGGVQDDTTNGVDINVPACTIDFTGGWNAGAGGSLRVAHPVTQLVVGAQSVVRIANSLNDLNKL